MGIRARRASTKVGLRLRSGWIGSRPPGAVAVPAALAAVALVAASACGCAAPSDDESDRAERAGNIAEAIYSGVTDNDATRNDSVVALKIGDSTQSFELCSASVIAPNVILTARHCVSKNIVDTVSCDEKGLSGNGAQVGADELATTMHVFLGPNPDLRNGVPAANGSAIFHPQSTALCNADIALVVLDRNLTNVTPLRVRLTAKTKAGESIRSVGYGENDKSLPVGTRLRKDNVSILATGSTVSTNGTPLASHEIEVGLSICQGDSGGPALSEATGAVVGVVSRGGSCSDGFGHIYTLASGFGPLFQEAFAVAGGQPLDETSATGADAGANGDGTGSGGSKRDGGSGVSGGASSGASAADDAGSHRTPSMNLRSGANDAACTARIAGSRARDDGSGTSAMSMWTFALLTLFAGARRRRR